jgi:hypothetical protein
MLVLTVVTNVPRDVLVPVTGEARMASPATSTHLPPLAGPHEREAVGHELQATLQELAT